VKAGALVGNVGIGRTGSRGKTAVATVRRRHQPQSASSSKGTELRLQTNVAAVPSLFAFPWGNQMDFESLNDLYIVVAAKGVSNVESYDGDLRLLDHHLDRTPLLRLALTRSPARLYAG
jgi:hypothetical protein